MENEAGYGKLTKDTILPYISSFGCSQNIQFPWTKGIEIIYYNHKWNDNLITHLYSIIPRGCKKELAVKEIVDNLTPAEFLLSKDPQDLIAPIIKKTCVF